MREWPTPDPPRWRLDRRDDMTPRGRRPNTTPGLTFFWLATVTAAVLLASVAWGADNSLTPTQSGYNANRSSTSSTNSTLTITFTPPTNQTVHLYGLSAFCDAGSATVSITNGGTTVWQSSSGWASGTIVSAGWTPVPLTGTRNADVAVTLSTCGASNTGTLNVQADIY